MSWSDRRFFLLGLAALPACGFTPVHGTGGAAQGLRGEIAIDPPSDDAGYILVRHLEERLGLPQAPRYSLSASIRTAEEGLGVTPDQEITRYQVRGAVTYTLTRLSDGVAVARGEVSNFTGYSAPVFDDMRGSIAGNTVSVLTAQRDAERRLMVILGDQIVARLLASAPEWRG